MAEKKTGAAKHSADYRDRKKAEAQRFGIETLAVEMAAGTRAGMTGAMKAHGYTQLQELLQNLHRSFLAASPEEQARRLQQHDAPAFRISPKLARQFEKASRAELKRDPGCEIEVPKPLPHGEQQCNAAQLDILE
ncbi:hypothetical protein [Pseudomonas vranovensis]|uniref:Uncharacterized protein n=1 Tax=Pseudomonas vranovensis TaxID=321661 RepID=A0A423CZ47_9PSED|nr:hypothetical protein [Pseudomonas vranovensis]ROL64579.1 hypothetical protein BHU25_22120 [Pseudomonas vranovensis]